MNKTDVPLDLASKIDQGLDMFSRTDPEDIRRIASEAQVLVDEAKGIRAMTGVGRTTPRRVRGSSMATARRLTSLSDQCGTIQSAGCLPRRDPHLSRGTRDVPPR